MVATTNLPGSQYFAYFVGSREDCEAWLEQRKAELQRECGGLWFNAYGPARIVSNREASTWRYRDGSRVVAEGVGPWS